MSLKKFSFLADSIFRKAVTNMNSKNVSFSVLIPFFNDSATIRRALDSISNQTLLPAEVIIVDDASTEVENAKLREILIEYSHLQPSLIVLPENQGPSTARNAGWKNATADFVAFLDADDSWHPSKLELQANTLQKNPEIVLLGTARSYREDSHPENEKESRISLITPAKQLFRNRFVTSSVVVSRTINNRFNENLRYSEDNDLWCRVILATHLAANLQSFLTFYHKPIRSAEGASGQYLKMFQGQYRVFQGLYEDSLISIPLLSLAISSAAVRFGRRMLLVSVDKLRNFGNQTSNNGTLTRSKRK
ncbi:glycosyltransferase family 2 protein [Corynebacterium efficiens]|uniref:glycosyltransferase family 2 protein n=1 Tax=Corynebacterium efficiens TaxID=152794 RepID=UPI0009D7880B|nr:glycosyltransferase family 2 protein [Corynebacterium efficiens]